MSELSTYSQVVDAIETASVTKLPGFLVAVLLTCKQKRIFKSDEVLRKFVLRVLDGEESK